LPAYYLQKNHIASILDLPQPRQINIGMLPQVKVRVDIFPLLLEQIKFVSLRQKRNEDFKHVVNAIIIIFNEVSRTLRINFLLSCPKNDSSIKQINFGFLYFNNQNSVYRFLKRFHHYVINSKEFFSVYPK